LCSILSCFTVYQCQNYSALNAAYKKAIREQKLALEISAAKGERDFYLKKGDQSCALSSIEERMKKVNSIYNFSLTDFVFLELPSMVLF
jgi:hypothetical protein